MVTMEQLNSYKSKDGYNFFPAFESVRKEFGVSDLIIANLETPVAGPELGYTHEQYSFNTPIQLLQALKSAGVDIVTTANNHCLDRKKEGLLKTIYNLKQCGLDPIGTHLKKEDSYVIREIEGIRIGLLSFTYGTNAFANGNYLTRKDSSLVDLLQEQELSNPLTRKIWQSRFYPVRCMRAAARRMHIGQFDKPVYERRESAKKKLAYYQETIKKCKEAGADYIAAYLHIGGQYNPQPTDYTKEICELSRKCGVNAVIANHEHVIHGIDWEHITDQSFCIYSLGNFLSSSGVIEEPYNKLAQYSAAVNIDLGRQDNRGVRAEYSFTIFVNYLDQNNQIMSMPLAEYINHCTDYSLKDNLMRDYTLLMNRIFNTKDQDYPLRKDYRINHKER